MPEQIAAEGTAKTDLSSPQRHSGQKSPFFLLPFLDEFPKAVYDNKKKIQNSFLQCTQFLYKYNLT
jgi:hypothetical protein